MVDLVNLADTIVNAANAAILLFHPKGRRAFNRFSSTNTSGGCSWV